MTLICGMPAYGDIVVEVQNASIVSGGTGSVDVLVSSDEFDGTDDHYAAIYRA